MVATSIEKRGSMYSLSLFFSLLNLVLFIVTAALAAHYVDHWFDTEASAVVSAPVVAFIVFSLLASAVGIVTSVMGLIHTREWNETARFSNWAVNMITLALAWLAGGFAIRVLRFKLINQLKLDDGYDKEFRALTALHIIGMATTLLYVILLGLYKHIGHIHTHTVPVVTEEHHHHNVNNVHRPGYKA